MKRFLVLSLLFLVNLVWALVVELPLERHSLSREQLRAIREIHAKKLGVRGRSLPDNGRFIESVFTGDYFMTKISFGTPARKYRMMINSGSTNAFLFGPKYDRPDGKTIYEPRNSTSSKDLNEEFMEVVGSYTMNGRLYSDIMHVYGALKVSDQAFGVIDTEDDLYDYIFPVDGSLGLSRYTNSYYDDFPSAHPSPIRNLLGLVGKKAVTVWINRYGTKKKGELDGLVTIGGLDRKNCELSNAHYTGLYNGVNKYELGISLAGFKFGGYDTGNVNSFAYFDSGLSTMHLPHTVFLGVYDQLQPDFNFEEGVYTLPCDSKNLPAFEFVKGKYNYTVPAENYLLNIGLGDDNCAVAFALTDEDPKHNIYYLGTPFMRTYCVSFIYDDEKEKQVALAPSIHT